ncbi:hypothetical protein EYF80_026864 [Liparis tanakae]|uniref:Uncharacterized protein n=1 Tax=Liparis tanakae TaxID=230148 RepID=A0A4Z2HDQ2_9TELE|nr:hypothetical protein EYF80_026864 [Liparis tanakae]
MDVSSNRGDSVPTDRHISISLAASVAKNHEHAYRSEFSGANPGKPLSVIGALLSPHMWKPQGELYPPAEQSSERPAPWEAVHM